MNASADSTPLTLACHPEPLSQAIQGIDAVMGTAPGHNLTLAFALEGDISTLRIPEPRSSRRAGVELTPGIVVHRTGDRLELDAKICQDILPPGRPLRLGLSAVVEDADGLLSYWALRHPPGKPDFHHTDAFAL